MVITLLFAAVLGLSSASPKAQAVSEVDLTRPETLPELDAYVGKKPRLGMEVELGREALAKLLPYFDDEQGADAHKPAIMRANRIIKDKRFDDLTPKKGIPKDLADTLSRLKWFNGGGVIEFAHKTPLSDPVQYMNDVKTLMSYAGVWEKANSAGRVAHGPWFSHHTHMSRRSDGVAIDPVARAWNALLALDFVDLQRSDYALGGDYSTFVLDVRTRGQLRVLSDDHLETRRQSLALEDDLKRSLFLLHSKEDVALGALREAIARKLSFENLAHLLSTDSDKAERLLRVIFHYLEKEQIEQLDPRVLDLAIRHGAEIEDIPVSLFAHYGHIQDEALKELLRSEDVMDAHLERLLKEDNLNYLKDFVSEAAPDWTVEERTRLFHSLYEHESFDDLREEIGAPRYEYPEETDSMQRSSGRARSGSEGSFCHSVVAALGLVRKHPVLMSSLAASAAFFGDLTVGAPVARHLYPQVVDPGTRFLLRKEKEVNEARENGSTSENGVTLFQWVELEDRDHEKTHLILVTDDRSLNFENPEAGVGYEFSGFPVFPNVAADFAARHDLEKHKVNVRSVRRFGSARGRVAFGSGSSLENSFSSKFDGKGLQRYLQLIVDAQKEDSKLALMMPGFRDSIAIYSRRKDGTYDYLTSYDNLNEEELSLLVAEYDVKRLQYHIDSSASAEARRKAEKIAKLIEEGRLFRVDPDDRGREAFPHERAHYYYFNDDDYLEPVYPLEAGMLIDVNAAESRPVGEYDMSEFLSELLEHLLELQSEPGTFLHSVKPRLVGESGIRVEIITKQSNGSVKIESIDLQSEHPHYDLGLFRRYAMGIGWW